MGDLMKWGKNWMVAGMIYRGAVAVSIVVSALAFAFGDGGTFSVTWNPGQEQGE